jgi:uncharacterized lipoprotein YmbA
MKHPHLPFALLLAALLSGCSTDQFARVIYYSFRVGNPAVESSTPGQARGDPVSYDRYQRERRGESGD